VFDLRTEDRKASESDAMTPDNEDGIWYKRHVGARRVRRLRDCEDHDLEPPDPEAAERRARDRERWEARKIEQWERERDG